MTFTDDLSNRIRVLRILEYEYPSAELMIKDRERWAVKDTVAYGNGLLIRSAVMLPTVIQPELTISEEPERL